MLLGRGGPLGAERNVDVEYVGGGGVGATLGGRIPGGSRSGGIVGVEPGGKVRSGHGNGERVRVLVLVDGRVGGNSVVAHAGGSFQPVSGAGRCVGTGVTTVGSTGSAGIRVIGWEVGRGVDGGSSSLVAAAGGTLLTDGCGSTAGRSANDELTA